MVVGIILAGGVGSRMNAGVTKQKLNLLGKTVIWHTVNAFESCNDIDKIIIVSRDDEIEFMRKELSCFSKILKIVKGGSTRAESSYNGILAIDFECNLVAIHDAARCLITPQQISNVISVAAEHGAATAAAPMIDTVKKISFDKKIVATVDRRELILVQTPQVFNFKRFRDEVLNIEDFGSDITDDNMIYERAGYSVTAVYVGEENIKITTWRDMLFAELILKERMNG